MRKKAIALTLIIFIIWPVWLYAGSCSFGEISPSTVAQAITPNQALLLTCPMTVNIAGQTPKGDLVAFDAKGMPAFTLASSCDDLSGFCQSCRCNMPYKQIGIGPYTLKAIYHSNTTGDIASCAASDTFNVEWLPPTNLVFTPASGAPGTKPKLTITGRHFGDLATVRIIQGLARIDATNVAVINDNLLTCVLPLSAEIAPGAWQVIITNNDGQNVAAVDNFLVTPQALIEINITPNIINSAANSIRQFTATGLCVDGSTQDITKLATWTSSNTEVAMFNNPTSGLATTLCAGTANITATILGITSLPVTLSTTDLTLQAITLTPKEQTIANNSAVQFLVYGTYSDNSTQEITPLVTFNSTNTAVATIDASGIANALSVGSTNITATLGVNSATTALTVLEGPTVSDVAIAGGANKTIVFSTTDFLIGFTDINGGKLDKIKILSLPSHGILELSGQEVILGQELGLASINNLTYAPYQNWAGVDSFSWNGAAVNLYAINPTKVNITITSSWIKNNLANIAGVVVGVAVPVISGIITLHKKLKKRSGLGITTSTQLRIKNIINPTYPGLNTAKPVVKNPKQRVVKKENPTARRAIRLKSGETFTSSQIK